MTNPWSNKQMGDGPIREAYFDPRQFGSETTMAARLKPKGVTRRALTGFRKEQEWRQRTSRVKRVFMPIIGQWGEYQIDITLIDKKLPDARQRMVRDPVLPRSKMSEHYYLVLTMVNVVSRYALARRIATHSMETSIIPAFEIMLAQADRDGQPVRHIVSDNEFNKTVFLNVLKRHKITYYASAAGDKTVTGSIEAFNLALRKLLIQYMYTVHHQWTQAVLDDLIHNYNTRPHTRTGIAPIKVTPQQYLSLNAEKILRAGPALKLLNSYKVDDTVRWADRPVPNMTRFLKYGPTFSKGHSSVRGFQGYNVLLDDDETRYRPRNLLKIPPVEDEDDDEDSDEEDDDDGKDKKAKPRVAPLATRASKRVAAQIEEAEFMVTNHNGLGLNTIFTVKFADSAVPVRVALKDVAHKDADGRWVLPGPIVQYIRDHPHMKSVIHELDGLKASKPKPRASAKRDEEYVVLAIEGHELVQGEVFLKARWKGNFKVNPTWEPLDNFITKRPFAVNAVARDYLIKHASEFPQEIKTKYARIYA
jgi:transposase InsO family protein